MMTFADRAVCAGILLLSIVVALGTVATRAPAAGAHALVVVAGIEQASLPLAEDHTATIQGRLGAVVVEVRGGAVAVIRSTCPHRVCIGMGWKRRPGEVIACVPNELLVRVTGGAVDSNVPDAVTR
jgi:hypothetical protein